LRHVVLERDTFAFAYSEGEWIFAGQDSGRSVRLKVCDADWRAIQQRAADLADAYHQLERLAALAPAEIDDGFGGVFVPIRLDRSA